MSKLDLNPSIEMREGEELDVEIVDAVLKAHIDNLVGQPSIKQFASGSSNLTYLIQYQNRDLVLRRPPFGTKAKGAHSMYREYRVMNQLKSVAYAVPETLYYTDDESLLGSEFYLMERVEGHLIGRRIPETLAFTAEQNHTLAFSVFDKLIELHAVDINAAGLADFGRPEGYCQRQVEGWSKRLENALTPDVDPFEDVMAWLHEKRPASESAHAIVHGDFRIDNVILDSVNPMQVKAVLDWEISALGDPLMDLANSLAYWVQADDSKALQSFAIQPSDAPGMPSRQELLEYYEKQSGLNVANFDFYAVYGYFRNAVILQQIYYRYFHGQTKNSRFASFGPGMMILLRHCQRLIAESNL